MSTPTLDVVIPVKYGSQYLPQALESVARQGVDARVVIVDDGAPVDLAELASKVSGIDTTVIPNSRQAGIGGARNTGAAEATRDLLAFLDADDVWPDHRTRTLQESLGGPDELRLAFGLVQQFLDGSATSLPDAPRPGYLAGGMLIRRSTWERVGDFDEELGVGEYIDWVARARSIGAREEVIEEIVLRRRIHGDNTTIHRRDQYADYADVVRRHLRRGRPG